MSKVANGESKSHLHTVRKSIISSNVRRAIRTHENFVPMMMLAFKAKGTAALADTLS